MTTPTSDTKPDSTDGIWIGIDLGTSNCACAVWDSTRGSPKWIRLPEIAALEGSSSKWGRLVPSLVDDQGNVGAQACPPNIVSSAKRLIGRNKNTSQDEDDQFLASLPFQVISLGRPGSHHQNDDDDDGNLQIKLPNGHITTPDKVISTTLQAIRCSAQRYLDKFGKKKDLQIPGTGRIRHVVIGVPAHFSKQSTLRVEQAARNAGFDGTVRTCLESTAAAMAYGLTLQERYDDTDKNKTTIMAVDMGGGTTDITIATKVSANSHHDDDVDPHDVNTSYKVLVTQGDSQLGGDDIDFAIMEYCQSQSALPEDRNSDKTANDTFRKACRKTKEALCDLESPSDSETIQCDNTEVSISQQQFELLLQPWLQRAKNLMQEAVDQLPTTYKVSEVILVGGTTRVPAIRRLIQSFFVDLELCTSLHPMSSVAQGLAIQAALTSKLVPLHKLKSALMLDCIPHAIGVELPNGAGFVEILPRNAPLPAKGSATFTLADPHQAGVSIRAVEQVRPNQFEPMAAEEFTFLLKRLHPNSNNNNGRTIEVGMMVDGQGQFVVSIFDEQDPEQVRKKERLANKTDEAFGELDYIVDLMKAESEMSSEQFLLTGILIAVFVLYVAVRIAFSEPGREGAQIL